MILHKEEKRQIEEKLKELRAKIKEYPDFDSLSIKSIPFYKFRERKEFRRRENEFNEIHKNIYDLENKLDLVSRDATSEEFKGFLASGEIIILTEEDRKIINNESDFQKEEDIVFIHKGNFCPSDNKIRSASASGGISERQFKLNGVTYNFFHKERRNTVHLSANGEVGSHPEGDFDGQKYAIIVPFTTLQKSDLRVVNPVDTFVVKEVLLDESCYILCPAREIETLKKRNPNVNIVGYDGPNVDGFADAFISFLGKRVEDVHNHYWSNRKDQRKYEIFMTNYDYNNSVEHMETEYYDIEKFLNNSGYIIEICERLLDNDVIFNEEELIKALEKNERENYTGIYYDLIDNCFWCFLSIMGFLKKKIAKKEVLNIGKKEILNYVEDFKNEFTNKLGIDWSFFEILETVIKEYSEYNYIERGKMEDICKDSSKELLKSILKLKLEKNKTITSESQLKI